LKNIRAATHPIPKVSFPSRQQSSSITEAINAMGLDAKRHCGVMTGGRGAKSRPLPAAGDGVAAADKYGTKMG
jgi:hypothetical protein